MAIFGDEFDLENGTIVWGNHNGTSLDVAMNYVYGITLLTIGIVGIFLNSLVLYEKLNNRHSRRKLTSTLFQLLAASNILLLLLRAPWPVYCLLRPKQLPVNEEPVTLWQNIYSMVYSASFGASITLVLLMSIVRYFKIRDTLEGGSSRGSCCCSGSVVAFAGAGYIGFDLIIPAMCMYDSMTDSGLIGIWDNQTLDRVGSDMMVVVVGISICGLISLVFSSLTIYRLRSSAHGQALSGDKRKSTYTILLLNVPDIVNPLIVLYAIIIGSKSEDPEFTQKYLTFFVFVMLQPISATYYAVIICTRSSTIKKLLAGWWRTLCVRGRGYQPI